MKIPTKAYVASLSENEQNRRDLAIVFIDQDHHFTI